MPETVIRYAAADGIATITLDNPPANTYSHEMMLQLDDAILKARFDDQVHVVVLTGAGEKFFCAGADIKMLAEATPSYKYYFCLHANETLLRLEHTPKLVIAALNGHTVGGGLEIALAADLRIASRDAGKIGLPEVLLGVLPGTGGTQRLAQLLGQSRALELMATGRTFSVEEAHHIGLLNQVFDTEDFSGSVLEYALTFAPPERASRAVGLMKRAVQFGSQMSTADGLALERELQQQLFIGKDAKEGIEAYMTKRKPKFTAT